MMASCPVCQAQSVGYCQVDGYMYFECSGCGIIHIDNATLNAIDAGQRIVRYDPGYWEDETRAAGNAPAAPGSCAWQEA